MQQFSDVAIAAAESYLRSPKKLAKLAEQYETLDGKPVTAQMVADNIRHVLEQQTRRAGVPKRAHLFDTIHRAALGKVRYGAGLAGNAQARFNKARALTQARAR